MARLKSEIWIKAYIRSCHGRNLFAVVVRKGDADAGAIYIKIDLLNDLCLLFTPAPTGYDVDEVGRFWVPFSEGKQISHQEADDYLARQINFDSDIWVLEVESPKGEHFLEEYLKKA
ncbi:MAG: DUF1491 family protein [Pseudomonadota bacterium]